MANNKKSRGQTDWNRVDRLRDADIRAAVKADPNAAPIAGVEWFRHAKLVEPRQKTAISIRLDKDLCNGSASEDRVTRPESTQFCAPTWNRFLAPDS